MRALVCILFALVSVTSLRAADDFDAANRAYEDGRYPEARQRYEALIAKGEKTANLYYNLGNANARAGDKGLAILDYERALAIDPTHEYARRNLTFLRGQSTAKPPQDNWRERAFGALSMNGWIVAFSALVWTAIMIVVLPPLMRRKLTANGVFALVLVLCASGYAGFGAWFTLRELNAAVVIGKEVQARRAPADRADLADVLPTGSRVRWLSERSGWVECELPDGSRGWVPAGTVERVRPAA